MAHDLGEGAIVPPMEVDAPEEIVSDFVEGVVEDAVLDALPGGLGDDISEAMDWAGILGGALGEE